MPRVELRATTPKRRAWNKTAISAQSNFCLVTQRSTVLFAIPKQLPVTYAAMIGPGCSERTVWISPLRLAFNDRAGDIGCHAAMCMPHLRRSAASAKAGPATGGKVRMVAGKGQHSECLLWGRRASRVRNGGSRARLSKARRCSDQRDLTGPENRRSSIERAR